MATFEMPSCGGCRTCEIACSFKHTGEFNPSVSSIKIIEKEDGLGFCVCLTDKSGERRQICDGCIDIDEPMCLQYCEKKEDLIIILQEFTDTPKTTKG